MQGIVHNQQWILPFRNGELPSKPPLFHWIAASGASVLGESDFTLRLPSAIGAGVMILFTFLLGRAMGGRLTGWLAVGALLGMYDFWHAAWQARVDMIFSACVTAAIAGFYFWYRNRSDRARTSCYLATVCAVLAKGPLGIALVGLVILGFLVVEKRPRLLWTFWSWPLVGLALVVIGGWYGWAYAIGGQKFLALQIGIENVERLVGGEAFPRRPVYLDTAIWLGPERCPGTSSFSGRWFDGGAARVKIATVICCTSGGWRCFVCFPWRRSRARCIFSAASGDRFARRTGFERRDAAT